MRVHQINDLTDASVINILKDGLANVDEYPTNYSFEHRENNANLFYILSSGRYYVGNYFVVEEKGKYIASAGWNEYDYETALVLTRAYVSKPYRTTYIMAETILPLMLEQCSKYAKVWITCNMDNKSVYNWFTRSSEGKSGTMFSAWPDIYRRFLPIGERTVNNTQQLVVELQK